MPKVAKKGGARRGVRALRWSAHEIWLAGLGALTLAEEEGSKLFKTLVRKGAEIEALNMDRLEKLIAKAKPMGEDASIALEKMGVGLDDGMAGVLHRLGVPTWKEIQGLTKRIEELTHSLERRRARPKKPAVPPKSGTPVI